jgi:hypothetical protein
MRLDKSKPYGTCHPPENNVHFEQDGCQFDNDGYQVDPKTGRRILDDVSTAASNKAPAVVSENTSRTPAGPAFADIFDFESWMAGHKNYPWPVVVKAVAGRFGTAPKNKEDARRIISEGKPAA